jgi:ribosomal protein S18 acetylase RimI-like enzyme
LTTPTNINVQITQASVDDLAALTPMFDGYRQFYGQPSDLYVAREFLLERLHNQESVIFMARDEATHKAIGFTQLYPSFSSVSAARIFIVNDLYVSPLARGHKVGAKLLQAAIAHGRAKGAKRLSLSTGVLNKRAQALYEGQGWELNTRFQAYDLTL